MYILKIMHLKKLFFVIVSCLFIVIVIIVLNRTENPVNDLDRKYRLLKINELIKTQASSMACKQPNLPVNNPDILKFVHEEPPIDCTAAGKDWVKCEGSECRIQEQIKLIYGPVKCSFTDIIRVNDFDLTYSQTTYSDSYYKLEKSDVVKAVCTGDGAKWSATLTGIRQDPSIFECSSWDSLEETALKMNVLMFGFDSISRNSFIRKLPKSYQYLKDDLNGLVLEGYNIVGDGTPQALIPLLTGKTELELPDTRKRLPNTKFVNSYPFIWNDFKQSGYVTAFFEDVPELSTFTYRLNGFDESPTDHYMRPYYLASLKERYKWPKLCTGDTPRHKVMLNQIKSFFSVYSTKPKFLFGFHGELSHDDYNLIGTADDDLREFLIDLNKFGYLNDTILILMADHGHRFAEIRNTLQGKQEERLPFFSFVFPKDFQLKYGKAYENFKSNLNKLTTPFDIYNTLKSVLDLDNVGLADIQHRSVSLFSKIPAERSCAHAYIEPHWCACLDWHEIPLSTPIVNRLGENLVDTINNFTQTYRDHCEILKISHIEWVLKMAPNDNLIKFNKNADLDGFVADLSATMNIQIDIYQIKAILLPGNSIFEASIKHYRDKDSLELKMEDISRINKYKEQAKCVEENLPQLRKYCYCK